MRMSRRKAYGLTALLCILLVVGLTWVRHRHQVLSEVATPARTQPVRVEVSLARLGPIDSATTAQGTLEPAQGGLARVASQTSGRVLAVRVKEGDEVTKGQVVAVIDNRAVEAQAVLALRAARIDRDQSVKKALLDLETARTELRKLRAGARPQEVAQADQAVRQAQATRDRATSELQRVQFLYDRGVNSKRQLEDARTALAVAEASLQTAVQQANLLRAGARPEDLRAAELRVQDAQRALGEARAAGDARVAQAQLAVEQVTGSLSAAARQGRGIEGLGRGNDQN